jgi:hypothetical protein
VITRLRFALDDRQACLRCEETRHRRAGDAGADDDRVEVLRIAHRTILLRVSKPLTTYPPVRAELVEALPRRARALRQAQCEREEGPVMGNATLNRCGEHRVRSCSAGRP